LFNGQASRPYNNTGTHLLDTSCKITSSDACRPTLLRRRYKAVESIDCEISVYCNV